MLVSTAFVVSWLLCSAWDRGKWGGGSSAGMSSCVLSAVYVEESTKGRIGGLFIRIAFG